MTLIADKYEVVREVGRGAFGVVHEARDTVLDRPVALKTIRNDAFASPASRESFEKRFLREVRVAARLSHPNVVAVYEAGTHGGTSYMAMEFVPGRTLRALLDECHRLPVDDVMRLAEQLLGALDYAHGMGVVHRDIKPENLMIRTDGTLKVTDFGIAKVLHAETTGLTRDGVVMGTPCYMAPEQILSKPANGRADLFSTSAVLYEMLTGTKAFSADSMPALLFKILSEPPTPVSHHTPVPGTVELAILKGMAKRPEDRHASGRELLTALQARTRTPPAPTGDAISALRDRALPLSPEIVGLLQKPEPPAPPRPDAQQPTQRFEWIPPTPSRPPDESASLAETAAPEVLLSLKRRRESGLLIARGPDWSLGLELERGAPFQAHGGPPSTALGPMLKARGDLDEAEYQRLEAELKRCSGTGRRTTLGSIAVRMGILSASRLLSALEAQIDARIDALVALSEGSCQFYRGLRMSEPSSMTTRPVEALIAKALYANPARAGQLFRGFCRRAEHQKARASAAALEMLPLFHFGPQIQRLLRALGVEGGKDVVELLAESLAPRSDAEVALYLLWAAGAIEILAPSDVSPPRAAAPAVPRKVPRVEFLPQVAPKPTPLPEPRRPHVEHLPLVIHKPAAPLPGSPQAKAAVAEKLEQADAAMRAKDLAGALELLRAARHMEPRNPLVLAELGWATFRAQPGFEQTRVEARKLIEEALQLDRRSVPALIALGKITRIEGDYARARAYFEDALRVDRDNPAARAELDALETMRRRTGEYPRPKP